MKCIPFIIAVNYRIVTDRQQNGNLGNTNPTTMHTTTITADDEIALLPPISGG
jgi:molybdopterin converting factor small subunit